LDGVLPENLVGEEYVPEGRRQLPTFMRRLCYINKWNCRRDNDPKCN